MDRPARALPERPARPGAGGACGQSARRVGTADSAGAWPRHWHTSASREGGTRMIAMDDAYALVVGIGQYDSAPPLPPTVVRHARELYALLVDPRAGGYPPENTAL